MKNEKRTITNEQSIAEFGTSKGDDIAERLLEFAVRIVRMVNALPRGLAGRHVGVQLLRSGIAPGAHYEEARGAESRADFVHKLGLALKELRESHYWLQLVVRARLLPVGRLMPLLTEADELCRIVGKSKSTARKQLAAASNSTV